MDDEVGAPPFHRKDLAGRGFLGFVPLVDLDSKALPREAGVYAVLREMGRATGVPGGESRWSLQGEGSHRRNVRAGVDVVRRCPLLYIGKASKTATTDLRRRLTDFRDYARGRPVGHQGGRYNWQVVGASQFIVCWVETADEIPGLVESALIAEPATARDPSATSRTSGELARANLGRMRRIGVNGTPWILTRP